MQPEDGLSASAARDSEWPAQHPTLDAALLAAIRSPVADASFDRHVWARIRVEASASTAPRADWRRSGPALWLTALNALAIGVIAIVLVMALGTVAHVVVKSAPSAPALIEHSQTSTRLAALVSSYVALWLGLRGTPFARAMVRLWS